MTSTNATLHRRTPVVVLAILAAGGLVIGWSLAPTHAHTFAKASRLLEPLSVGTLCFELIRRRVTPWRWLVPLLLGMAMLTETLRFTLSPASGFGLAASVLALLCCVVGRRRPALATTTLCCGAFLVAAL